MLIKHLEGMGLVPPRGQGRANRARFCDLGQDPCAESTAGLPAWALQPRKDRGVLGEEGVGGQVPNEQQQGQETAPFMDGFLKPTFIH